MEEAVARVASNKEVWFRLPIQKKIDYVNEILSILKSNNLIDRWGEASSRVHVPPSHRLGTIGYLLAPGYLGNLLQSVLEVLKSKLSSGKPPSFISSREDPRGCHVVHVGPRKRLDKIVSGSTKWELQIQQGKPISQGETLKKGQPEVVGILGAGNVECPSDIIIEMFVHNRVAVYKPNPVNERGVTEFAKEALQPLIRDGFLTIVPSDLESAKGMVGSSNVDSLYMTGSHHTFNTICFGGVDAEAEAKRQRGELVCKKPFCAELGNVSPWIVAPGSYTSRELAHQAGQLCTSTLANAGHFCMSPQLLITDVNWDQRAAFIECLLSELQTDAHGPPYYPGAAARIRKFAQMAGPENCTWILGDNQGKVDGALFLADEKYASEPGLLFITAGLTNHALREFCAQTEAFAPILVDYPVDFGADLKEFLPACVEHCNTKLWGTLSATLIVCGNEQKKNRVAIDTAVSDLRYGAVGVNTWGGLIASEPVMVWGAYCGQGDVKDIGSGNALTNNVLEFDHVAKCIVTSNCEDMAHHQPTYKKAGLYPKLFPRLARTQIDPGFFKIIKVMSAALFGL